MNACFGFTQSSVAPSLNPSMRIGGLSGLSGYGVAELGQRYEVIETTNDPDTQVWQTMPLIQDFATRDAQSFLIKDVAARYAAAMPGASIAQIAWKATKDHLIFVPDDVIARRAIPNLGRVAVEVLRRPVDVVLFNLIHGRKADGDCDDHSMMTASIAQALGGSGTYETVAVNPAEPGVLSHIYTMIDGVPCDASHGDYAGWQVPASAVTRRVSFPFLSSGSLMLVVIGLALAFVAYVWGSAPGGWR